MKRIRNYVFSIGLLMFLVSPVVVLADETENPETIDEQQIEVVDMSVSVTEETEDIPNTEDIEVVVEEETSVKDTGPSNEELFEQYVDKQFGVEKESNIPEISVKKAAKSATIPLSGLNSTIYDLLSEKIAQVAAGNIETTVFNFTDEELQITDQTYTAAELGVTDLIYEDDLGTHLTEEAKTAYFEKVGFNLATVNKSLLYNHPYELYWYDKSTDGAVKQVSNYSIGRGLHMTNIRISMLVSSDFSATGNTGTNQMNTDLATSVQTAVENAQGIVDQYASLNDYDKLVAYKDEICNLVSYNREAADDKTTPYGNPWQMIWVFDGDDTTNVVCEGYSKAFDYLCSKSTFINPNLDCYLVSGYMDDEGHMWNIVTFGDNNYLVDVTNSDRSTVGYPNKLFLVGNEEGSVEDGYTFTLGRKTINYVYDSSTTCMYTVEQLTLSTNNYLHASDDTKHTLSLDGNIGVNFYMDLVDAVISDADAYVVFIVDGVSNTVNLTDAAIQTIGNVNYYRFSVEVTSVQMASDIKMKVYTSDGDTGYEDIYSVKMYCDNKISDPSSSKKLVDLCKALLNYGGYAQINFNKDVDNLANANVGDSDVSDVTVNVLAPYVSVKSGSEDGITLAGSTLTLDSLTTIKHYFGVASGHSIDEYTFKLGDAVLTPIKSSAMYYIEIPNIASNDLDTMYTVSVGDYNITYSALSYAYNQVKKTNTTEELRNACRALYKYNQAADAYFN